MFYVFGRCVFIPISQAWLYNGHTDIVLSRLLYICKWLYSHHILILNFACQIELDAFAKKFWLPIGVTHFLWSIRNCFMLLTVPWGLSGPLLPGTGIIEESPSISRWLLESLKQNCDSDHSVHVGFFVRYFNQNDCYT